VTVLFLFGYPPQIKRNRAEKRYYSGPCSTWLILFAAHFLLGLYMLTVGEMVVMWCQVVGVILALAVLTQSYLYDHAGTSGSSGPTSDRRPR